MSMIQALPVESFEERIFSRDSRWAFVLSVAPSVQRRTTFYAANFVAASVPAPNARAGHVIAGVGTYHQRSAAKGSNNPGLNIGAGISPTFGSFGAFTETRMNYIADGARIRTFPIMFGLEF